MIIASPVLINYLLLTWRAWRVNGGTDAWIGFFGSYLGLIGAVGVALFQFKTQRDKEIQQDKVNNRSFISAHDFSAPVDLRRVVTHENSRLIETQQYTEFKDWMEQTNPNYKGAIAYYKISQFGAPDIIMDCKIVAVIVPKGKAPIRIETHVGIVEKGIEIFLPVTMKVISDIEVHELIIDYRTIRDEKMRYYSNPQTKIEKHLVIKPDGSEEVIMKNESRQATWIYPKKLTPPEQKKE